MTKSILGLAILTLVLLPLGRRSDLSSPAMNAPARVAQLRSSGWAVSAAATGAV